MNTNEGLVKKIDEMLLRYRTHLNQPSFSAMGIIAETQEFISSTIGQGNSFYKTLAKIDLKGYRKAVILDVISVLESLKEYIQAGKLKVESIEAKIRIEVVSEILEQANTLLNSVGVHPAAPAVLIGAALEEYLRKWVEREGLSLESKKPSIDSYSRLLRENGQISAQDIKDITSWGGLRNAAAHGKWDEVNDKNRVLIMLEGVNLFMRQTSIGGVDES